MFDEYSFSSFPFQKGLNTIKSEIMGPKEIRTIFKSIKMSAESVPFDCAKYNGKLKNKNTSKEESKIRMKSLFQISTSNSKEIQVTSSKQENAL